VVASGGESTERPIWPAWASDEVLLFNLPSREGGDGNSESTVWASGDDGEFRTPVAIAGPDADIVSPDSTDHSYQDVQVHPDPGYRADAGPRMASFGGEGSEFVPWVSSLIGLEMEAFDLGSGGFTQCHHPAWNPDGTRILCTRHESVENPWTTRSGARLLYAFTFDGREWSNPELLFDPPSPSVLAGLLGEDVAPATEDGVYTYKYAEWDPTGRFVLATLLIALEGEGEEDATMVASRVVLIRVEGEFAIWDITAAIAEAVDGREKVARTWQGVYGTTHEVSG
jgi:hypothetical protein